MTENTGRTPHPEDPAEGAPGAGDPRLIPEHGTAPDGRTTADEPDVLEQPDRDADGSPGGAIQGDADPDESTGGAIQGDAGENREAPLGGDETTRDQLTAENAVESDMLKTLDPDDPPA
jgi:hypothetical protein